MPTPARVAFLSAEWREAIAEDLAVLVTHRLAPQTVEESCLTTAADGLTEATRRQTVRGVRRDRLELVIALTATTAAIDLGDTIKLEHSRYGLTAGKNFLVLGIMTDAANESVTLTCWG